MISTPASTGAFLKEIKNMPRKAAKGINPVQHSERSAGSKKGGKKKAAAKKNAAKKR